MKESFIENIGLVLSFFGLTISVQEITSILGLILTILNVISAIVFTSFKMVSWYKKAKQDGKITKEELKEGMNILQEGKEEITNTIKEGKDNGKK